MKVIWNDGNIEEAKSIIEKWLIENDCTSGETAQQSDNCQINAINLIADLADLLVETEDEDYL